MSLRLKLLVIGLSAASSWCLLAGVVLALFALVRVP